MMDAEIPDRQLQQWGIKRMRMHRSALRGLDELIRMSRHSGRAFVYPVRPDRTVLVWQPFNRFLQPAIAYGGRTRITNRRPEIGTHVELPVGDGDRLLIVGRPELITHESPVLSKPGITSIRDCILVTAAAVHYETDRMPEVG